MDLRTIVRELEEVISKAQAAADREVALLEALPQCALRRRKQRQVTAMRAHVSRLRTFRSAMKATRRPGLLLH